jgi:hypothetical protein
MSDGKYFSTTKKGKRWARLLLLPLTGRDQGRMVPMRAWVLGL